MKRASQSHWLLLLLAAAGALCTPTIPAQEQAPKTTAAPQAIGPVIYTSDDEHEELVANTAASTGSCGVERWSVKTGTDADVGLVNFTPVTQTISYLRSQTAPSTLPANNRVAPNETTTFQIDATLTQYKLETDSDYHLVIQDASGNTMIVEIPDPACVGAGSPFKNGITSARQKFDAQYTATTSFQTANIPVRVTGVGMFDFLHGQTGVAPNGIELHAILDIVFNPGSGTPDFALSASPASVSVTQGANATTVITETPSNGFTGSVALFASGLPAGVTASFNPSNTTSNSTLTLTASSTAATGTSTVTITGSSGTLTHTTTVTLTVNPAGGGGGAQTAVYNSTLKAPSCATVGTSCDSGPSLLLGRANLSGGTEPNQPNTINSSCADGTSGTFHSDESNDRLMIASADGGPLTAGKSAKITATVWAYSSTADALDLYSAADAANSNWVFLSTIVPSATGAQTLSTSFTLPTGGTQAIRANFRYQGSASSCSTGAYDDHDDLIFAVAANTATPDFTIAAAPSSVAVTQGANASIAVTIASQNGFSSATSLSVTGVPSGVTAAFSANPVTPVSGSSATSTLTFTASSSALTGPATVTVTGTSGSLSHSASINLTVNAAAGDTTAPTVSASESGSSGTITLSATASDNVGVAKVEFYVDNVLKATDTTSPYSATLDSTTLANGSHNLVARAYDAAGNVGTSSTVAFSISNTVTATELIANGGFESGATSWTASSGVITNSTSEAAHTGSYKAWLDGYGAATTDTVSQTVTIPSTAISATLTFWLHIDTAETTTTTAYDKLTVQLLNSSGTVLTTLATYSNLNAATGYTQKSFDVSAYKGQTVQVYFKGVEDSQKQTSFVLDDVSLKSQ